MRFPDLMRPPICTTVPNSGARRQHADSADHVCGTLSTWTACPILLLPLPSFSMTKDSNSPATKADIQELCSEMKATKTDIVELRDQVAKLADSTEKWKDEMLTSSERWKDEILTANERWKDELVHHFDVAFENFNADLFGAFGDRYESIRDMQRQHGQRLNKLESKCGIRY